MDKYPPALSFPIPTTTTPGKGLPLARSDLPASNAPSYNHPPYYYHPPHWQYHYVPPQQFLSPHSAPPSFYNPFHAQNHSFYHQPSYDQIHPLHKAPFYQSYHTSHHFHYNHPPPHFPHRGHYHHPHADFYNNAKPAFSPHSASRTQYSEPIDLNDGKSPPPVVHSVRRAPVRAPLDPGGPPGDQVHYQPLAAPSAYGMHSASHKFQPPAHIPEPSYFANMVIRTDGVSRRPRRDYFIFSAMTYELMVRALRADLGLPEFTDPAFEETAISHQIPLSSAHHPARLTRKKWMRLKSRLQWHDCKPLRRCLTWKSCPLLIVPEEDWPTVLYECFMKGGTGSPSCHGSFNCTYHELRKQYQTRRSRCGIPRDVCDAFMASTATYLPVAHHHLHTRHPGEEEEEHAPAYEPQCCSSSTTTPCRSSKRSRSVDDPVHDASTKKPCHKSISITSLLSEPKLDSATELMC